MNAGRPGYLIPYPFIKAQDTELPVYGYSIGEEWDPKNPGQKRRRVAFSHRVDQRPWFGVTHEDLEQKNRQLAL